MPVIVPLKTQELREYFNLLDSLRKMGVTVDFAPSKLRQGYGEQAIFVLDRLSDEALRASQFQWFKPSGIPEEGGDDEYFTQFSYQGTSVLGAQSLLSVNSH